MTPKWFPLPSAGTVVAAKPGRASTTFTPILCAIGIVDSMAPFLTPMDHDLAAVLRRVGDAAGMPLLPWSSRRLDSEVAQHCSQHHIHLHVREYSSDASPGATTERDPREAGRLGADEALRIEAVRVRKCVGVG